MSDERFVLDVIVLKPLDEKSAPDDEHMLDDMHFRPDIPEFVEIDKVFKYLADVSDVVRFVSFSFFVDGDEFVREVVYELIHELEIFRNGLAADLQSVLIANVYVIRQEVVVDAQKNLVVLYFGGMCYYLVLFDHLLDFLHFFEIAAENIIASEFWVEIGTL